MTATETTTDRPSADPAAAETVPIESAGPEKNLSASSVAIDGERPALVKRFLPKTLLGRSLLIIITPLVLVQVIATWVFYDRHYDTITKRLTQGLAGDIAMVIEILGRDPQAAVSSGALRRAQDILWLDITVQPGKRLERSVTRPVLSILDRKLWEALDERLFYPFVIDTSSELLDEKVIIEVQLPQDVVQILVPLKRLFSSTTYIFIFWMVGSSIVLFGVATVFMRNQVKPIRRLAHAADDFGKGRDVPDFRPEGATEVRQAAAAFLQMRGRIKRQIEQRTELLAGVSHDLRTPLTRMKLQLAMLPPDQEVISLASDVDEMQKMVEGYLAFARGEGTERARLTNLSDLLRDVVTQMRRDGCPIDLHIEQEMVVSLRPDAIRRCVTNLIANAQRYGRHVSLRAGPRRKTIEITVDDDGPGIPEAKREDVFKPFYRIDQSRNPETGGTGLGLTIARDVIRRHGGDLTLEDAPGGGLRARLWLPF